MQSYRLNNGFEIPSIGYGTFKIDDLGPLMTDVLKTGYRMIDSAIRYGNEESLGRYLKSDEFKALNIARDELFVTTKIPPNFQGTELCKQAVNESLEKLQLDYIDLVLIHWPGVIKEQPDSEQHALMRKQTYQQLEQFCEQGLIRSIGVSNYTVRHLEELFSYCKIKPAVNQIEVHPLLNQSELRNFCQKNDILVQAYSPLGSAAGVQQLLSNPVVNEIASQVSKTPAQVLIRWSLQVGCCVLVKSSNLTRLKENYDVMDFKLSDDQMQQLSLLNENVHFCWDPTNIL